jgi:hypothetical protein
MTIKIQKILYDLISQNVRTYTVYSCKPANLKLPYIVIQNIEIETLPYSEELYRYENVDATIKVYDNEYSNKNSLDILTKISTLIGSLSKNYENIKNVFTTLKSCCTEKGFTAEVKINFTYLN